ncbi:MAG: glucosamine-6-phosphate deaminase [Clostridia bacterium]|jgi:glucosamine-6-phosphate deaminase|nr:glucosamine-6-phosphate deaminase [Clostridia bacterium]
MQIIVCENYDQMSFQGAEIIKSILLHNPSAVLGLATGSTPIGMYGLLAEACARGEISFAAARTVNLDEYVGLGEKDSQSYVHFMRENLFDKVDVPMANTHLPNGKAADLAAECARYSALLATMPQDVQVLGLGSNGHIGFNEPGTPFDSTTYVVRLTENTIRDNSRLFEKIEDVPVRAVTMGISEIMRAKRILVMASGKNKAKAVFGMVKGKITEDCPASVLQRHADVTVVLDKDAASLL